MPRALCSLLRLLYAKDRKVVTPRASLLPADAAYHIQKSVGDQPYTLVLFRYGVKYDATGLVLPAEAPLCEGQNSSEVVSLVLPAHTACAKKKTCFLTCCWRLTTYRDYFFVGCRE
jgi:hypothetical protein